MKWMKWIGVLAVLLAMGLATSGCGGGDDGGGGIEGTWKADTFGGQPMPAGVSMTITFSDNGTYAGTTTYNGVSAVETGTWSTSGNQLITVHEGETENVTYVLSGNTLTVSDPEGVFVLQRQ